MKKSLLSMAVIIACALACVLLGANSTRADSPRSEVIIGKSIHSFGSPGMSDQVKVEVTISTESSNPVLFRWKYLVKNISYNFFLCDGLSGLHLDPLGDFMPDDFSNMISPGYDWETGWEPYGPSWWNQYGTGIMPGQQGEFSFTTVVRFAANITGYYFSHLYGAPVGVTYFPTEAGPLGPGDITELPSPKNHGNVAWFRTVPPWGYCISCPPLCPQPPFDYDLNKDGTPESWSIPIFVVGNGRIYSNTDAYGSEVILVGIPGKHGPGCGGDHYSARIRLSGGDPVGIPIGQCVYEEGRNSFYLQFDDADDDKIPDKFTKSEWISRNKACSNCPGNVTYFLGDLTKEKIVVAPVISSAPLAMASVTSSVFSIPDAVMINWGTDLSTVIVNGDTIGLPEPGDPGTSTTVAEISRVVNRISSIDQAGVNLTIHGTIANYDATGHTYNMASFGIGSSIGTMPPLYVAADATESYMLNGTLLNPSEPDTIAVVTFAYAETGDWLDTDADAFILETEAAAHMDPVPKATGRHMWIAPNPFAGSTKIEIEGPLTQAARVEIFDVKGRLIKKFVLNGIGGGRQSITWDGRDGKGRAVASGAYFCRLLAGEIVETRQIRLIK